jgi:hypothetical protein
MLVEADLSLGQQIDALAKLKAEKKKFDDESERLQVLIDDKETTILQLLETTGIKNATGVKGRVAVEDDVYPEIEDWNAFWKYCRRMNLLHLLQRRPAVAACRELFEKRGGKGIPGVIVPKTVRKLKFSKL